MVIEEDIQYPKDGKKLRCWFCEMDDEKHSEGSHLIAVRVFESDRYLCLGHLLKQILYEFASFVEKVNK